VGVSSTALASRGICPGDSFSVTAGEQRLVPRAARVLAWRCEVAPPPKVARHGRAIDRGPAEPLLCLRENVECRDEFDRREQIARDPSLLAIVRHEREPQDPGQGDTRRIGVLDARRSGDESINQRIDVQRASLLD
jgi:hypothetical protein